MPDLDADTRERIRAEELERLKVRQGLEAQERLKHKPNYWLGIILSLIFPGLGLLLARQPVAMIGWVVSAFVLAFAVSPVAWFAASIGSAFHFSAVYDRFYSTEQEKREVQSAMHFWYAVFFVLGLIFLALILWQHYT